MSKLKDDAIRGEVRSRYAQVANAEKSGCGCGSKESANCCGGEISSAQFNPESSISLGYSSEDMQAVPEGANMGLGCGNPGAIASLKPGNIVLDLGSGGGFDAFLAARQVGPEGKVIGVDMTPDMVSKARSNSQKGGYQNVDFRLGEIERLPVADNTVDVIISNCVINLSPDKAAVFNESFRVLRQDGRIAISDVVAIKPLTDEIKQNMDAYSGCIGGAALASDIERMLVEAGFSDIKIDIKMESDSFIKNWFPGSGIEHYVRSAVITAIKQNIKIKSLEINESTKELIAIGASTCAHCQPCLEYHLQKAKELGIEAEDVRSAIEIGYMIEKGAMSAMKKFGSSALEKISTEAPNSTQKPSNTKEASMKTLKVYDPAMCCSSGVCGPKVDPELAQFLGTMKFIEKSGDVAIERYNLGQQPQAFVSNTQVKSMLANGGEKKLPFIFINDTLIFQSRYPSKEELLQALGINEGSPSSKDSCCSGGGCCS